MDTTSLLKQITEASSAYYSGGDSGLSDFEFDQLVEKLRVADPQHKFFSTVGSVVVSGGKVKHQHPMLSLSKITTQGELIKWLGTSDADVVLQAKLDGCAVELFYRNGIFETASTRGDGFVGEDVTLALSKTNIPKNIRSTVNLWIRGEVVLSKDNWAVIDPQMKTNPRNVGTGVLTRDDAHQCELLNFVAVEGISDCRSHEAFQSESTNVEFLTSLGFETVETIKIDKSLASGAWDALESFNQTKRSLPYWVDGAVLKFNSLEAQDKLGVSSGRPKGKIAFKWASEEAVTRVSGVTITVGHTGCIVPTAKLEPVKLMGVTVQNALLNNWDEISRLGLKIGDYVTVIRTGEIIPKIINVVKTDDANTEIVEPTSCPCCGGKVEKASNLDGTDGAVTTCTNFNCSARAKGRVKLFVKSFDLLGFGDEVIEALFDSGLVSCPVDLYKLDVDSISSMPVGSSGSLGLKRATNLVEQISTKGSTSSLHNFLGSLGIQYLGSRRAELMIKSRPELADLDVWLDGSTLTKGLTGKRMEHVMVTQLAERSVEVKELAAVVLSDATPTQPIETPQSSDPSSRLTFVLTGTFSVKKAELQAKIKAAGHLSADSITKETNYLVQADAASVSNKTKKAIQLGVKVLSEADLIAMLS